MEQRPVEFHPAAVYEAQAAREWYALRSSSAADAFIAELDEAIAGIVSFPKSWSKYLYGTRHRLLARFPYIVVYRELSDEVQIVAVAHARRRPGYWMDRTGE